MRLRFLVVEALLETGISRFFLNFDEIVFLAVLGFFVERMHTAHQSPLGFFFLNYFKAVYGVLIIESVVLIDLVLLIFLFISADFSIFLIDSRFLLINFWFLLSVPLIHHLHQIFKFFSHQSDEFVLATDFSTQLKYLLLVSLALLLEQS